MRWLITGGCGFIGTSLLAALQREGGHQVRVFDDLSVGSAADLGEVSAFTTVDAAALESTPWSDSTTQLVVGDVRDEALTTAVAHGADVIIHLAANTGVQPSVQDPRRDCTINVLGTLNLLEAARAHGVRRFVLASSGGTVIGDSEPPIHENLVPRPKSPYGASKSAGEGYLSAYHGSFGIDTVALRFSNVYGPRSSHKNSVVARCIRRALEGRSLEIFGDGLQTRDYVYIDDLVAAIRVAASADGLGGEVYQVDDLSPLEGRLMAATFRY